MAGVIDCDYFIHHSEYDGHKNLFLFGGAVSKHIVKGNPIVYVTGNKEVKEYSHRFIKRIENFDLSKCIDEILKDISE